MEEKELFFKRNDQTSDSKHRLKFNLWHFVNQYFFRTSPKVFGLWRCFLLRAFGAKIGKGCYISSKAFIYKPWLLEMGNCSSIDDYCYFVGPVTIGDYVSIGNNVHLVAGGHDVWSRGFEVVNKRITINHGAFIGSGAFIGMGCEIGQMAVVGTHCQITENIPENTIVALGKTKLIKCRRLTTEEYSKYKYNY